jgi:hypothetical protein
MSVSPGQYLKGIYGQAKASGQLAISSDAMIEFTGFEGMAMQLQGFPWPVLSPQGNIEVPTPLGGSRGIPQQVKTMLEGEVTMQETTAGSVSDMLLAMIAQGGTFNGKVYEGDTTNYKFYLPIYDAFLTVSAAERNWENRSQIVSLSGSLTYHFFGEKIPGNL